MAITAVMIDQREPEWVCNLKFGGAPTMVTLLEHGDLMITTDDGCVIGVERKTPDDFLNTLRDERLLPQLAGLASERERYQVKVNPTNNYWPYLVITGPFLVDGQGKIITDRGTTNWSFAAVQGAILSIQEMGIFVTHAANDADYEATVLRIGRRDRKPEMLLLPPRPPNVLGGQAAFLAGLPGVGLERVLSIMQWSANNPAHALVGLTDLAIEAPVGPALRKNIRRFLGLKDGETIELVTDDHTNEQIQVFQNQPA